MEIVYVHLGSTPNSYLGDAIQRSLSIFPNIKHTLILDNLDSVVINPTKVNLVKNVSKVLELETMDRTVDLDFRKGYWNFTLERIFAVLDYQIKNDIKDLLHVESDVVLLPNFPFDSLQACKYIHWCEYGEDHDVAALLHIPSSLEANSIQNEMISILKDKPNLTDMQLLFSTRSRVKEVKLFPSQWADKCNSDPSIESVYCDCFPDDHMFDGLTLGMFITGQDPRNNYGKFFVGDNSPFESGATHINPRKFSWSIDESGILAAKSLCCEKTFQLQNLHVHSKNKKLFKPEWQMELSKLVGIANERKQVRFYNSRVFWEMLKNSINDGKFLLFIEKSPPIDTLKSMILALVKGK
jgi:hypothetical protein